MSGKAQSARRRRQTPPAAVHPALLPLTARERHFVLTLLADPARNQTKAYAQCFKAKGDSARANAAKCLAKDRVRAAFEALVAEADSTRTKAAIADRQERQEILTGIARKFQRKSPLATVKAVDTLNKMDGVYVQKHGLVGADGTVLGPRRIVIELDDASSSPR